MTPAMTAGAARSLNRAAKLAQCAGETHFSPWHLFWAILCDESRAAEFLVAGGVSKSDVPADVAEAIGAHAEAAGEAETDSRESLDCQGDTAVDEILFEARRCARRAGPELELGSEHLLWGILQVDCPAAELLHRHEVDTAALAEFCGVTAPVAAEALEVDFEIEYQSNPAPADPPADPPSDEPAVYRIVDAAANRAREGLRVIEDYARFQRDDARLSRSIKEARHELTAALEGIDAARLIAARDTEGDVGTAQTTEAEAVRHSAAALATANFKRVQEALRTLEEYGKLLAPELGARCKQLRYRIYTLEKAAQDESTPRHRLAAARLYLLVTKEFCAGDAETVIREAIAGGADVIQIREKTLPDRELLQYLKRVRELTRATGTLLIVNDRPDLAVLAEADGVHVGQQELPALDARKIVGPQRLVGVSTRCLEQADEAARNQADYLGVGPVFPSTTKHFSEFAGLDYVGEAARGVALPWFAIGGIDAGNVQSVRDAGATRVAVGRAVTGAADPAEAARRIVAGLIS